MKVKVPSLDVKRFEALWERALTELPGLTKEWTNYNLADPGVVAVEGLLFLLDVFYWRLDFFGEEEAEAYRALLKAPPGEPLHLWWQRHLSAWAGVTARDLAQIIKEKGNFDRVYVYPDLNTRQVRVTVIARSPVTPDELTRIQEEIEAEGLRPLTLEVVLKPPQETLFSLNVRLYPLPGYQVEALQKALKENLSTYLSPLEGLEGQGYPPGRPLYLSEIYACLEKTAGVDGVAGVSVAVHAPGKFDGEKVLPGEGRFLKLFELSLFLEEKEESPCL